MIVEIFTDEKFIERYNIPGDNMIYIPELKNFLIDNIHDSDKITICGGGKNECLKEIELLLNMLNIKYIKNKNFIY
jgi:hypothetical protein